MDPGTDRIEKQIRLSASRARVWRAITDVREFGVWFGVNLSGLVGPGLKLRGPITSKGYEYLTMEVTVETFEPETRYAFRWHPNAVDPQKDYSDEPTTLVTFTLEEIDGGTLLTIVESGFDGIPASRRMQAFDRNSQGWTQQLENIRRHLVG
jgi:uncharacterized protein YndB with AHSA1/START domain